MSRTHSQIFIESIAKVLEAMGKRIGGSRKVGTSGVKLDLSKDDDLSEVAPELHKAYKQILGNGRLILPRRGDTKLALKELGKRLAAPRWVD